MLPRSRGLHKGDTRYRKSSSIFCPLPVGDSLMDMGLEFEMAPPWQFRLGL